MTLKQISIRREYKAPGEKGAKVFALKGLFDKYQKSVVLDLCEEIYDCETRGDLRQAIKLLAPYWTEFSDEIKLAGLNRLESANILLRIGSVASTLGSAEQIKNSQEKSRDYLSHSRDMFDELEDSEGKAQCQNKIGVTYWRNGDLETAQIFFRESLFYAQSNESKAIANLNIAMIKSLSFRYSSALEFYEQAYDFIGKVSIFTEAKIRNGIGLVYKDIGKILSDVERIDYFDKAIIELEGALICYEEVQNSRSAILVRNNIGFLYYSIGLYDEALRVLEIAESEALRTQDKNHLSIVSDTLARTFIAQGNYRRAIEIAAASVYYLESSENSNLLATALITCGIALARNGEIEKAKAAFNQAGEVAGFIQDFVLVAVARLFALREMLSEFSPKERLSSYLYAVKNLSGNQEKEISDALRDVAAKIESEIEPSAPVAGRDLTLLSPLFSLDKRLKTISRQYIEAAIREECGNQSRAAALLGMSRQTFVARVKKDFSDLLPLISQKDKAVKKVNLSASSAHGETDLKNEKLALTEIQSDYREIRRGDFLLVKPGVPETDKHVIIGGRDDESVKIGFFIKDESGYFLASASGDRFQLTQEGKNRIIGEVVGFCRRADFHAYLAELEHEELCELSYEELKV